MIQPFMLFIFDSPTQIIFVVAIVFLLFGASRLPQLAKSLGQTQKAFKDGLREAEEEDRIEQKKKELQTPSLTANLDAPHVTALSDEELMAEMRRRVEVKNEKI